MRRLMLFMIGMFAGVFGALMCNTLARADGPDDQVPLAVADGHHVTLTPLAVTIITGLILPFVVALITKLRASSLLKGVVGVVLAIVAAVIERATLTDGSAVISAGLLVDVGMVYIPQITSYLGLWSHAGINQKLAPNVGLG